MLATASDIHHAMNLSPADICRAFDFTGYTGQQILSARFRGFNGSSFVYTITYPDEEAEIHRSELSDCEPAVAEAQIYVNMITSGSAVQFSAEY